MLSLVAALTPRRARMLLAAAIAVAALAALLGTGVTKRLSPLGITNPSSQSTQADTLIGNATGAESPPGMIVLLNLGLPHHHRKGSTAELMEGLARGFKIHQLEEAIKGDPAVKEVQSALDLGTALTSRDRSLTYLAVRFRAGSERKHVEDGLHLASRLRHWPRVKLGGPDIGVAQSNDVLEQDVQRGELLSFPILLLLSIWFFRGLVAALLPVVLGASAIVLTRASLSLVTHFVPVSSLVLGFVTALGIGLGIDYSLLIVSRFREELHRTPNVHAAVTRAMATAGRTVMFSAATVATAMASLLVMPQQFFYSMGLGGVLVALLVCLAALTILPALLLLLGPRINALSPKWLQRSASATARPVLDGRWYRLATAVMRRPVVVAVCACTLMLALVAPALGIKLAAVGSASALPTSTSVRQVGDTLASQFKLYPEHAIEVVAAHATNSQLSRYRHTLERLPGEAAHTYFQRLKRHVAVMYIAATGDVPSAQAQRLVRRIRDVPTPFERRVGGPTANFIDLEATMTSNLPLVLILVMFTTSLAVFLLTGSVVLPPKTMLMNALTVAATLGVMVLVFQHGYLQGLLGYASPGGIAVVQPVLLIAIAWGLSTDYGVFLIDRIREIHDDGASNEQAIALGLERTGRITTTAALLLCVAIGSLATSRLPDARELSLGVVVAVLLDATVVRALLVPALMRLLGEANWWSPAPLRKLHRRIMRRPLPAYATQAAQPPPAATQPPVSHESVHERVG